MDAVKPTIAEVFAVYLTERKQQSPDGAPIFHPDGVAARAGM